jgi:hypothetical protein
MKKQGRPNDMTLSRVFENITEEQKVLFESLDQEHPNDLVLFIDKDNTAKFTARQEHWLLWVDYLVSK